MDWLLKAYNKRHPHLAAIAILLFGFGVAGLILLHWPI